jgi:hypothetical protein
MNEDAKSIAELNKATDDVPFDILLPCLLAMEPPKTEPVTPQPELKIENPYVPLAHGVDQKYQDEKFKDIKAVMMKYAPPARRK